MFDDEPPDAARREELPPWSLWANEDADLNPNRTNGSASGRLGLNNVDRRQLLHFDAVRQGDVDVAEQLVGLDLNAAPWQVAWASDTDLDPRLLLKLHVGSVTAVAWGVVRHRPLLAVCTRESRTRVWDVLSGRSRVLPCAEPVRCLAFAMTSGEPVLITAHDRGRLEIWNVTNASLQGTVNIGDGEVTDLYVTDSGHRAQVVTLDSGGRVQRWSLSTGERVDTLETARSYSMCGGRLADGRHVLLTDGDGLSLWDLDSGERLSLRVPPGLGTVRRVMLSTSDGRDHVTAVEETGSIVTFDLATGARTSSPITAHLNRRPDGLMQMWRDPYPYPRLAVVSGTLAVPTPWRVHLWDLATSQQRVPPLTGPIAHSTVRTVRWRGRELLLTSSAYDGVVALWDLDLPVVRAPGHDQRVSRIVLVESADVVVSADEGGTIVTRHSADGRPATAPLATGVEGTRALAAWFDGRDVIVATGAGSNHVTDGDLRRWNMATGAPYGPPVHAHRTYLHCLSRVVLRGREVLVTFGPDGMLKIWHPVDGVLLAETPTGISSKVTGFATGVIDDRVFAALSSYSRPTTLYALDDPATPPIVIAEAHNDVVLDITGSRILTAHAERGRTRPSTVRGWSLSGDRIGPDIRGTAEVTSAVGRTWPTAYIGRVDGTVSLTDLETGLDLCAPMMLPGRPAGMTVTDDGDLVVGFGSDLARVRPPVSKD